MSLDERTGNALSYIQQLGRKLTELLSEAYNVDACDSGNGAMLLSRARTNLRNALGNLDDAAAVIRDDAETETAEEVQG